MNLEIKEPCHEDWDKMKIGVISRHCAVCDKGVMDFTKMNRAEIITYLLSNPNDEVCGRLNRDQFDFHHEDVPILIETLRKQKSPNAFLILTLVSLSLASCSGSGIFDRPVTQHPGKVGYVTYDSTSHLRDTTSDHIQGQTTCPDDKNKHPVKGEVMIETGKVEPELMGDIAVEVEPESGQVSGQVVKFAEKMPEYPGGLDPMQEFIKANLKYPEYEKKKQLEGIVYTRFIVQTDGSVQSAEILKTVEGSKNFNQEVLRVIALMPKWIPGENQGVKVATYMTLPVVFKLKD